MTEPEPVENLVANMGLLTRLAQDLRAREQRLKSEEAEREASVAAQVQELLKIAEAELARSTAGRAAELRDRAWELTQRELALDARETKLVEREQAVSQMYNEEHARIDRLKRETREALEAIH